MTFGDGTTARLVGWAALEGNPAGRSAPRLSCTSTSLAGFVVADAAEGGRVVSTEDAAAFAALAMVIALGWRLFGATALAAAGLDDAHPDRYDDRIRSHLADLAAGATGRAGLGLDRARQRVTTVGWSRGTDRSSGAPGLGRIELVEVPRRPPSGRCG